MARDKTTIDMGSKKIANLINPLTSPGEVVAVFTYPYLSAGAPEPGEAKGLMNLLKKIKLWIQKGKYSV